MTALEAFAILILAGILVVLFYYYLKEMNRTGSAGFDTLKSSFTQAGKGVSDAGNRVSEGISQSSFDSVKSSVTDAGKKVSESGKNVSSGISQPKGDNNVEEDDNKPGLTERVSGMGESLKGKVKGVSVSTDSLSGRIDEYLDDRSEKLIEDWELATKSDTGELEKRYNKVARDIDDLKHRFNEYRGHANKKFEHIEQRLDALEVEDELESSK